VNFVVAGMRHGEVVVFGLKEITAMVGLSDLMAA
jgi:hypothetical protein